MSDTIIQQNAHLIQEVLYDFVIQMKFGDWLKQQRDNKRVSGPELEKRSGVSRQYISNLETGHTERPSREYAIKIAKGLQIDVNETLEAAGYAPEKADQLTQKLLEAVKVARRNENYTDEELIDFQEEMEYQIKKKIERILDKRST